MEIFMSTVVHDDYLEDVKKNETNVVLYLMNGFQLRGKITAFDDCSVVVDTDGKRQLVYKHAISTVAPVIPSQPVRKDTTGFNGYQARL